jgi:pimeloyl-ACP methyl ester carboxylesterase
LLFYSVVAAHLAASRSDRVVAAILIGPIYPRKDLVPGFEDRIRAVEKHGMEVVANTIPHTALAPGASPIVKAFIRELLLGQDAAGYISNCRVLINAKAPNYGNIAVPVLVIAGEEDGTATPETARKLFDELGTTEKKLEVLPAVGHWQCLEAAEEVGKQILTFYREIQ